MSSKLKRGWKHWVVDYLKMPVRWIRYFLEPGRYVADPIPVVNFEITNICNSKCIFCPYPIMKRKKEPMSMEVFTNAVDHLVEAGAKNMTFCVTMGDPLLDPHLFERAHYVRTRAKINDLGFLTTLQWLHRWNLNEFLSLFSWIQISLSLSGPESYKNFFGVDLYAQMLKNLESLLKRNVELGKPQVIMFSLKPVEDSMETILNHPDFNRIAKLTDFDLATMARDSQTEYLDDWGSAVELPPHLKARLLHIYPRAFLPCRFLYSNMMVFSNGNIAPCNCRDYEANSELILGNAKKDRLLDVWNGEKLKSLRYGWRRNNKVPSICKTCRQYRY